MAVFYVDPVNGSDANSGSLASPWQTIQNAVDNTTSGDVVRAMVGDFFPIARVSAPNGYGADASPVIWEGADANGEPLLSGRVVFDGSSLPAGSPLWGFGAAASGGATTDSGNVVFRNIEFKNAPGWGIENDSDNTKISLVRCRVTGNGSGGVSWRPTNRYLVCARTDIDTNAGPGIENKFGNRGAYYIDGCRVHNNIGVGIRGDNGSGITVMVVANSLIYGNGSHGLELGDEFVNVANNTVYGNTGDGIRFSASAAVLNVINNSISGNGGFGVNTQSNFAAAFSAFDTNHFHNNTSGDVDISGADTNTITGDPLFADAANGDFTPASNSPLANAGIGGGDIGAVKAACPAGGGSGGLFLGSNQTVGV